MTEVSEPHTSTVALYGDDVDLLARRLGLSDAVVIGLGSMLGAGIFVAYAPAAASAGSWLLVALTIAALVAYANAIASARLAALYPQSGGTYVYGRERLGPFWGYLAGWAFVAGKLSSCAAMAWAIGIYVWPDQARWVAIGSVVLVAAITSRGITKGALVTRVIVAVVVTVLVIASAVLLGTTTAAAPPLGEAIEVGPAGVLTAAGFLFFAFAGYARIATLGEEVIEPERTIPRAIPIALGITVALYALVAVALLRSRGAEVIATDPAPLASAVAATGLTWSEPVVRVTATLAAFGSLLGVLLGVSRTGLAMARDRHLPPGLAAVHPRHGIPLRAELAAAGVVIVLVLIGQLATAISFSSICVLTYYAIANASARTLPAATMLERALPVLGFVGCVVIAVFQPLATLLTAAAVLVIGAVIYALRHPHGPADDGGV
ncbi:MAG: APC family permease [Dermatophilaceae bacterium]|nr:APC family permease [Intrasporangiaceae bacterium]